MPPMAGKASLGRKNRTAISLPGPCDYCHSIGVECHIDETKRRQRPFYFVSEEEFRNLQEIVRYYQPGTELTPEALRSIASNCKKATHDFPDSSASLSPDQLPDLIDNQTPDYTEGNPHNDHLLHQSNSVSGSDAEITIIQDAFQLNQKLGCLLADSQGQYREQE
ncbi:hypothetical protein N7454_008408 [Penicillium verhagenii]|nr:hypothetical protein N7454_008408 [Penicillium verhagenii]